MNYTDQDVENAVNNLPVDVRQKIAAVGPSALLAEMYALDANDPYALLVKIGRQLAADELPMAEIRSGIESFARLTEGK